MATAAPILKLVDEALLGVGLPIEQRLFLLEEDVKVARETVQRSAKIREALAEENDKLKRQLGKERHEGSERERMLVDALRKIRKAKGEPEINEEELGNEAATILRLRLTTDIAARDKEIDGGLKAIARLQELLKTEQARHSAEETTYSEGSAAVRAAARKECEAAWRVAQGAFAKVEGLNTIIERLHKEVDLAHGREKVALRDAEVANLARVAAEAAQARDASALVQAQAKEKVARAEAAKAKKDAETVIFNARGLTDEAERRRLALDASEKDKLELGQRYILLQTEFKRALEDIATLEKKEKESRAALSKLSSVVNEGPLNARISSAVNAAVKRAVENLLDEQEQGGGGGDGKGGSKVAAKRFGAISTPTPRRPPTTAASPAKSAGIGTPVPPPLSAVRKAVSATKTPAAGPKAPQAIARASVGRASDPRAAPYRTPLSPPQPPSVPAPPPHLSAAVASPFSPSPSASLAKTVLSFTEYQGLYQQAAQQGAGPSVEEALLSSSLLFPSSLELEPKEERIFEGEKGVLETDAASLLYAKPALLSSSTVSSAPVPMPVPVPGPASPPPPPRFKTREERLAYEREEKRAEMTAKMTEAALPAAEMAVFEGLERDLLALPAGLLAPETSLETPALEVTAVVMEVEESPGGDVEVTAVAEVTVALGAEAQELEVSPVPRAARPFPFPFPVQPAASAATSTSLVVEGAGSAIVAGASAAVDHTPPPKIPKGKHAPKDRNYGYYF